jgi:N-acetylmuramic acid 6-phosphate etherase
MAIAATSKGGRHWIGIECGGTKSTALAECADTGERLSWKGGAANLKLSSDAQLLHVFRSAGSSLPAPKAIAIGIAGARTPADFERIRRLAAIVWPHVPCTACNDLETALAAAPTLDPIIGSKAPPQVLILSGTGSCCVARKPGGPMLKIGGWGHILGDKGSAYEIGLRALKAVVYYLDRDQEWSLLGKRMLRALALNGPEDLIDWVKDAGKDQIAALAMQVFEAAKGGDRIAKDVLEGAAASLAKDALLCASKVASPSQVVQFVLAGSVLLKQPAFAADVRQRIRVGWKPAVVSPLREESVTGALRLAKAAAAKPPVPTALAQRSTRKSPPRAKNPRAASSSIIPLATAISPTERRNPKTQNLDRLALSDAIELFLDEDAKIASRIGKHHREIERTIRLIVKAFQSGGRLFYVGAGTSGRLGVLDASECPPTFRTAPDLVQGIMAGGVQALHSSIEGAEDDPEAGARAIHYRGVSRRDVVVGIAASGRTPFVWGALAEARKRGAKTVLVAFNPHLKFRPGHRPDRVITVDLGPELLTGSTRLKSGTATKLILNLFTTLSMVKLGKVVSNLMIDLNPSNLKLRGRAIGIIRDLTGVDEDVARSALERSGWRVKEAWLALGGGRT